MRQLKLWGLLRERYILGVILGLDPLDAVFLGGGFFGQQMEAVVGALNLAHHRAAVHQTRRGAVHVLIGRVVHRVHAGFQADVSTVAQKSVSGVAVDRFHHQRTKSGIATMAGDPRQILRVAPNRIRVPAVAVLDGFATAHRGFDFVQAENVADQTIAVAEAPGGLFVRGQYDAGDPTAGIQIHFITGQWRAIGAAVGSCEDFHLGVIDAVDAQQLTLCIADTLQALAAAKRCMHQLEAVPGRRIDLHRQGHPVVAAATDLQYFDQPGLVRDTVALTAQVFEMKTVEFLFLDIRLGTAAGDLVGFAGAQGQDAVVRGELREVEVPADAIPGVQDIDRAETQAQGKGRAAKPVAIDGG
ncbi:hypothetical protein D3C76_973790 [compost metagenome]